MGKKRIFEVPSQLGPVTGLVRIGAGAMGAVFKGHHTQMAIDVAVKVLNPKLGKQDPISVQRFVREVRLLAKLRDPQVISIMDAGQHGPYTYAIMELIRGQSLDQILDETPDRRLAPAAAAYYLASVARGLHAVHQCGIVHRDIKPENIMVDTHGMTKIADFGLARGEDSTQLTMADQVVGTPEYMAPEMVAQEDVTGVADQYSLGITGYELLTGKPPFHKGSLLQIVQKHLYNEPVPLSVQAPDCPPELAKVVMRLLAKKPEDRYPNALAAAEALQPFASQAPPYKPEAASDQIASKPLQRAAGLPPFVDLFLAKLLAQHNVYPLETLIDGLAAAQRLSPNAPFAEFLVQRAGLPQQTAQRAHQAAQQALIGLRNRIAFSALQSGGRVAPEQLSRIQQELRPGSRLETFLGQHRLVGNNDLTAIAKQVDATLTSGAERSVQLACQQYNLAPPDLGQQKQRLQPAQFHQLLKAAVQQVVNQLP